MKPKHLYTYMGLNRFNEALNGQLAKDFFQNCIMLYAPLKKEDITIKTKVRVEWKLDEEWDNSAEVLKYFKNVYIDLD